MFRASLFRDRRNLLRITTCLRRPGRRGCLFSHDRIIGTPGADPKRLSVPAGQISTTGAGSDGSCGRGGAARARLRLNIAYLGQSVTEPDLFALPIAEVEFSRLEDSLRRSVIGEDPFLNEVATHLVDAGGKRIRPSLTIAAASLGGGAVMEETLLGGVSVELVHLAS